MNVQGELAIVTGAGSGMGQAIAWSLVSEGFTVVGIGRSAEKLAVTKERSPSPMEVLSLDVRSREEVSRSLSSLIDRLGTPKILVNNAGVNIRNRAVDKLSPDDFDKVISTNLTGAFHVTHAVLPSMISARDGLIVSISSIASLRPLPLAGAAYSASKYALNGFMGTLAREVAPHGIRSTLICPGEVATPILDERPVPVTREQREAMLQPEDVASAVLFVVKLPKRAHVTELVIKPTVQDYG